MSNEKFTGRDAELMRLCHEAATAPPPSRPAWIEAAAKECADRVLVGAGHQTFAEIIERHAAKA